MRTSHHHLLTLGVVSISLLLIAPAASFAQKRTNTTVGTGTTSRRDRVLSQEAQEQNREASLRNLSEGRKTRPRNLSTNAQKVIVGQIFEDFERIQIVNSEMMQASATLNATTCKQIAKLAEEMNKRAKRLKSNLGVADLEGEIKDHGKTPVMDQAQFRASLQTLDASVRSFVRSPLFQDPRVTDVRHLEDLRQDISNVIELSRTVKKAAEKLH